MPSVRESQQPECTNCGACCFSTYPEYIRLFEVDLARFEDRAQEFTLHLGERFYMRMHQGRCAALQLDPVQRRFTCAVYATRPDVCRCLVPGSGACLDEIECKRDRSRSALERLGAQ
jgi:uncharacterized protein